MWRLRTSSLLLLIRTISIWCVVFIACDRLLFSSQLYFRWLAPESYAGKAHWMSRVYARPAEPKQEILMLGDSRMRFAFSSEIADSMVAHTDLKFTNGAMWGIGTRSNFYLMRDLDPKADRFAIVVVGLAEYDDYGKPHWRADQGLEIRFSSTLLRFTDVWPFARSFRTGAMQWEAARTCLLKGPTFLADMLDLAHDPSGRWNAIRELETQGMPPLNYPRESMVGLIEDRRAQTLEYPPEFDTRARMQTASYYFSSHNPATWNGDYRRAWLGAIVDHYAGTPTKVVVVRLPCGSFYREPAAFRDSYVWELARAGKITVIDENIFNWLEQTKYFVDPWHLNRRGQRALTGTLTGMLATLLGVTARPPLAAEPAIGEAAEGWAAEERADRAFTPCRSSEK